MVEKKTEIEGREDAQRPVEQLVVRFAEFVDSVEYSVIRAEEPHWCAIYMTAEDADDLLPALREVLRIARGA